LVKSLEGWITPKESTLTSQPTDCFFYKIEDEQIVYRCPRNFNLEKERHLVEDRVKGKHDSCRNYQQKLRYTPDFIQ